MDQNLHIACAFDGSEASATAHELALRIAADTNLPFESIAVETLHRESPPAPDEQASLAAALGVKARHTVLRDVDALSGLAEHVARTRPALLVMGDHGHSPIRRLLIGSTTLGMIRLNRLPVLVARCEPRQRLEGSFHRVLAPVDLSAACGRALRCAAAIVGRSGGSLDVQHVIDDKLAPPYFPANWSQLRQEDARQPLRDFIARHAPGAHVHQHIHVGSPHTEICKFAWARESDLIVMSRSGRGALERMLIGSVTERVIGCAPCPVLVLPTEDHPTPWTPGGTPVTDEAAKAAS